MAYSLKYQIFRLVFSLIPSGTKRSRIIMNKNIFQGTGDNIFFQPRVLPADPEYIILHNNICIASNVTFITHDVFRFIFNNLEEDFEFGRNTGCIEIMDNVAIGSNVTILPDIRIGPNAIVGAGSVITKDVPEGTIVAGNPGKVIGSFNDYIVKRRKADTYKKKSTLENEWEDFFRKRK